MRVLIKQLKYKDVYWIDKPMKELEPIARFYGQFVTKLEVILYNGKSIEGKVYYSSGKHYIFVPDEDGKGTSIYIL